MSHSEERSWLTASSTYEGVPILFRRPAIVFTEYALLSCRFPRLMVIEQLLQQVQSSGLPTPDYNETLEEFDQQIASSFANEREGVVFLVETLAGKRTYYVYVVPSFNPEPLELVLRSILADAEFSIALHDDPKWRVGNGYARDFSFA